MAQKHTIRMPIEYVKKALYYLDLNYSQRSLANGSGIQLKLTSGGFKNVSINTYKTDSVVVQPYDDLAANFVRSLLAMRATKLRRMMKIE